MEKYRIHVGSSLLGGSSASHSSAGLRVHGTLGVVCFVQCQWDNVLRVLVLVHLKDVVDMVVHSFEQS